MKTSQLVTFYLGKGLDVSGRMIDDILSWSDEQLEDVHDYIQWLFPLPEKSSYNSSAPLLTEDDVNAFKESPQLRKNLLRSFARLLEFYGFYAIVDCKNRKIIRSDEFEEKSQNWLIHRNHNFLRITRILKSLILLGCSPYAVAFLNALEDVYKASPHIIGEETLDFWRNAVRSQ